MNTFFFPLLFAFYAGVILKGGRMQRLGCS